MRHTNKTMPATRSVPALANPLASVADLRLLLCMVLALTAGLLAYQLPATGGVAVGWPGDRLFLHADAGAASSESLGFYADELTPGAPGGRSRWTRRAAQLTLPGLGHEPLDVTLTVQGWPALPADSALRQPEVTVWAGNYELARFTPDGTWHPYAMTVPAGLQQGGALVLRVESDATFTDSLGPDGMRIADARPKGVRLALVEAHSSALGLTRLLLPDSGVLWRLALVACLLYLALRHTLRRPALAFVVAVVLIAALALLLAFARLWTAALLPLVLRGTALLLLLTYRHEVLGLLRALLARYSRSLALAYGLLAACLAWLMLGILGVVLQLLGDPSRFWAEFPDSLLYVVFLALLLTLLVVQGRGGLAATLAALQRRLLAGRLAPTLLLLLGGLWMGYEALLLRDLPMIGHADYADNAVVARSLLAGRGFVVDYVTQFYRLYGDGTSLTRPQETWPLLQPLWIAPFFAAFGPSAWAARLPNLVFNGLLLLLIYRVGTGLWDRRVGLCAALLVLGNILFFNMTIYATSDLAFVVFATAAIYALYRGAESLATRRLAWLAGSGLLTGLMVLQRPSAGLIAAGMGLWLLWVLLHRTRFPARVLLPALLWGTVALALLSPYVVRNIEVFGKPFYSTESHDAWVIEYAPEWDAIYNVYVPEPPLAGPGVPDRSWILRWGFDRTLRKFEIQLAGLRNLLLPPWENGPLALSTKPEESSTTLLHTAGGWLALVGLIGALRGRGRLLGLLAAAFGPYLLFLLTYWHIEERYLPLLMPWLALLAMSALWSGYDQLATLGGGRWSGLALAAVLALLVASVRPSWHEISRSIERLPVLWAPDLEAYQWLRTLPAGTVVMSRGPWQLNFYSERPALMIPNTANVDELLYLASYYRARYLLVETIQNSGEAGRASLQQLTLDKAGGEQCRPTLKGEQRPGRRLPVAYCSGIYTLADGSRYQTVVYRLPEGNTVVGARP